MTQLLIVEDNSQDEDVISIILTYNQIQVESAHTVSEALHRLETHRYDGILVDLHLPGESGWELVRKMRENGNETPCFAITAYHSPSMEEETRNGGFNHYFKKPLDPATFASELVALLA